MVSSVKDTENANSDRVQMAKGWFDANGDTQDNVFDLAPTDGVMLGSCGEKMPDVGRTFAIYAANYTKTIGKAVLAAVWADPAFQANRLRYPGDTDADIAMGRL